MCKHACTSLAGNWGNANSLLLNVSALTVLRSIFVSQHMKFRVSLAGAPAVSPGMPACLSISAFNLVSSSMFRPSAICNVYRLS